MEPRQIAGQIHAEIQALPTRNTPGMRTVRRRYSRSLKGAKVDLVLGVARELLVRYGYRDVAYELIQAHPASFACLRPAEVEELGQGIDSWWAVDSFARLLSGPAWRDGQVSDDLIHHWARSPDRWWRRAALVSTVALNVRSHGGRGDAPRTLAVCCLLVDDHDDMVVKAMSWALRALVVHDSDGVEQFIQAYDDRLAARVKREARNKMRTGVKNPPRAVARHASSDA
jgi:3-methyladenine DNA glycosylase AlkD